MKMLRGEFMSVNWIWEMPTAEMSENIMQNSPDTIACGIEAKRPPNFPVGPHMQ